MKCNECGFENKDTAKFCSKCGCSLEVVEAQPKQESSNNTKIIIAALVIVIIVLAGTVGYFALSNNAKASESSAQSTSGNAGNTNTSNNSGDSSQQTTSVQSSSQETKQWELIGTYSGSGSGSQSISVPAGQIMVKISAYPIKNYATNHLYVKGSNGQSAGVDWGSHSDVETRSDSVTYTSSSPQTFTIDYYETVSWQVEFYRYQ